MDLPDGLRLVRIVDEPALWRPMNDMCASAWPEFMLHDAVVDRLWGRLLTDWPEFQAVLVDRDGVVVAAFQSAPLAWEGSDASLPAGWDDQLERAAADHDAGRVPDTLGALQINVAAARRGQGLSRVVLDAMRDAGRQAGFASLIACVRPTGKARYPLLPIDAYAAWRRPDGRPVDPWLRVHATAGARLVRASPRSMTIRGTTAEWSAWTGLAFPATGPYVVEGALTPVDIDVEAGVGVYHDPNVWMVHDLRPQAGAAARRA